MVTTPVSGNFIILLRIIRSTGVAIIGAKGFTAEIMRHVTVVYFKGAFEGVLLC
jgi:hypothetical protein